MQSNGIERTEKKVGIIMLNTHFPRLEGDIGNPSTFNCESVYLRVDVATVNSVISDTGVSHQVSDAIFQAALTLENQGVDIILTSCGFLGELQHELKNRLSVPIISSSLTLVPFLRNLYGTECTLGVMTFDSNKLRPVHFNGHYDNQLIIRGVEKGKELHNVISNDLPNLNRKSAEDDVLEATDEIMKHNPKAIILECTNLSPYIETIRRRSQVPVFDLIQASNWILGA